MKKLKWNMILMSAVYLALGVFLIAEPTLTLNVVCYTLGAAVLVASLANFIRYFSGDRGLFRNQLTLVFAILCLALGAFLILRSDVVISILPILFGLFVVFDSVARFQNAFELRRCGYGNWWAFLLLAVLSIALGVVMIANPFGTMETLVMAIGVILCIEGALNLLSTLYTGIAVRSYLKKHPVVEAAVEAATGTDWNGDGVVAAEVTAATVEGDAVEVAFDPAADEAEPEAKALDPEEKAAGQAEK